MSVSKEQLEKLLKDKGITPNAWGESQKVSHGNNSYIQKQIELVQGLKSLLELQLQQDKQKLNDLVIQKSKLKK